MRVLELFCGTKSFSKVAIARGHDVFTVDNDPQHNPNLCIDILDLTSQMIIERFGVPDIIWASPPCTTFSVASIHHYWIKGKPKNEKTLLGLKIVEKTIQLIKELNPKFFIIENPRGMLRKQDIMVGLHRDTVTYCQYGLVYQKATDLWNNLHIAFKPMCSPNSPCHVRAPRGSTYGIQGVRQERAGYHRDSRYSMSRDKIKRAIVPELLCLDIIKYCENKHEIR